MTRAPSLPALVCLILVASTAHCAPCILWASDPVRPDEAVLLLTEGCSPETVMEAARLGDTPPGKPSVTTPTVVKWTTVRPLQASRQCVKAVIPVDWTPGVFALRLRDGGEVSSPVLVNSPQGFWLQGDEGQQGTPGGWVRAFGKNLSAGAKAQAVLRDAAGADTPLAITKASCWSLQAALPAGLRPGQYTLFAHAGSGGPAGWSSLGKFTVISPVAWKTTVFAAASQGEGASGEQAIHAALDKARANGGGVVLVKAGSYDIASALEIPQNTILKGEGPGLVSFYFKNSAAPPEALISGRDYGLANLAIYCYNYRRVIATDLDSQRFRMDHVIVRAIPEASRHYTIKQTNEVFAALHLQGCNFQITHSDIYCALPGNAQGHAVVTGPWGFGKGKGPYYGLMTDNEIYGHMYGCENLKGMIFERNSVTGVCLSATTYWNNFSQDVYVADCAIRHVYGGDREIMTFDGAAGAYFGKLAAVSGTHLTLAADPVFHDAAPTPHTDYRGGAVFILDGKGAGQYRFVTADQGREWDIDRPWLVAPDETSTVSIVPFRGRNIFVNNTFTDGGAMQLYGSAADEIIVGNKGARIDGFYTWGLNGAGFGFQPAWTAQYFDNELSAPSGFGGRVWGPAFFGVITSDDNPAAGPLARGNVLRRNALQAQGQINIGGSAIDTLIERCTMRHSPVGIRADKNVRGLVLRSNVFEDVTTPISGDGAAAALVLPRP